MWEVAGLVDLNSGGNAVGTMSHRQALLGSAFG